MHNKSIKMDKSTVTKKTPPNLMRIEVEKTRRAYDIANRCGMFCVPKILDFDEKCGVAVFERLDVSRVSQAVSWGKQRLKLAEILGKSLAVIHRELALPDEMRVPLPKEFVLRGECVFLHGDVSVDNVCVGSSWPPIVILDWQMTPNYGGYATYGTPYFDILWFISNLINRPFARFVVYNPVAPVIDAFLKAYVLEANYVFNKQEFASYAVRFFSVNMPRIRSQIYKKSWGRAKFLLPYCQAILDDFLQSLNSEIITDAYYNEKYRTSIGDSDPRHEL